MKIMSKVPVLWSMTLMTLALISMATTAAPEPNSFYVGGALGASEYDDDGAFRSGGLDNDSLGLKVYGGYRLDEHFSVEASLSSLGNYETETAQTDIDTDFGSIAVSLVADFPVTSGFSVFGLLGVGFVTVSQNVRFVTQGNFLISDDESDAGGAIHAGLGVAYTSNRLKSVNFRLGWERYFHSVDVISVVNNLPVEDDGDQELDLFYLGAAYLF